MKLQLALFILFSFVFQTSFAGTITEDPDINCTPVLMTPFIATWQTDNISPGSSCASCITIPTSSGLTYSYDIDWENDGTFDEFGVTGDATHDYGVPGTYTVAIQGVFPSIHFNGTTTENGQIVPSNNTDVNKILSVDQWGDISWRTFVSAFESCINLVSVDETSPDLSNVASLAFMFSGANNLNSNLAAWDVSNIIFMNGMFQNAESLIADLSSWDVSKVTNMRFMFSNARNFNSDLSSWKVDSVTNMRFMFQNVADFDSDLSSWNVGNVTDFGAMFNRCTSFNSDLSAWDVASAKSMNSMFNGAELFESDLGGWKVNNVTNMRIMFQNADNFNSDLSSWQVDSVTDMTGMFFGVENFTSDLESWNVSNVTEMRSMFAGASSFTSDLSSWDVSKVTDMGSMFRNAISFDSDLSSWNLISISDDPLNDFDRLVLDMLDNSGLSQANYEATLQGWSENPDTPDNLNLGALNLEYCDETGRDALLAKGWTIDGDIQLNEGDTCDDGDPNTTGEVIQADCSCAVNMVPFVTTWKTDNDGVSCNTCITIPTFPGETYNYEVDWNYDGVTFDVDESGITGDATHDYGVAGTYTVAIRGEFPRIYINGQIVSANNEGQKLITVNQWGDIIWSSMDEAFSGCGNLLSVDESSPNLSNVLSTNSMFRSAANFNSDISNWNVSSVTDMSLMFYGATNFDSNLSSWDVSNVTDMNAMFFEATNFDSDVSSWNVNNVTNMRSMFNSATNFKSDISNWNVENVVDMNQMFRDASNFDSDISNWKVNNVEDMTSMFLGATLFDSEISNWDVSNVTSMRSMFNRATNFNSDISSWNVSNVENMSFMFFLATSFNSDISNWNVGNVEDMTAMFDLASSFNQNLSDWNLTSIADEPTIDFDFLVERMLNNSGLSQANYEATLLGWSENPDTPDNLNLGALNLEYCDETGRNALLAKGWTIIGDNQLSQGDTCDDGDPNTTGEVIQSDCSCAVDMVPFVTTWKTDNDGVSCNTCVTIPTNGGGYDYEIDWNYNGTTFQVDESGINGDATHDYGVAGTYTVAIRGEFPRIYCNGIDFSGAVVPSEAHKLISVDQWGDIEWARLDRAFSGCINLLSVDSNSPDLSNTTSMIGFFSGATSFNSNLNMWDVSNVTSMGAFFRDASSFNSPLSDWTVGQVTNFNHVFDGASSFNQDLSSWNLSNATGMLCMFRNATSFNSNISSWNVGNVRVMSFMFSGAINFNQNLGSWELASIQPGNNSIANNLIQMLDNSGLSQANYEATLLGWSQNPNTPIDLELGALNLRYCDDTGRSVLIDDLGWSIEGDIQLQEGDSCDDGDPNTLEDRLNADCGCEGRFYSPCEFITDSLALIDIYMQTDGPSWTNSWNTGDPMGTWFGVSLNER